jgi:hypothetical protein
MFVLTQETLTTNQAAPASHLLQGTKLNSRGAEVPQHVRLYTQPLGVELHYTATRTLLLTQETLTTTNPTPAYLLIFNCCRVPS